jgi:hypothetical protein
LQSFPPGVKRRLGDTSLLAHLRHAESQPTSLREEFPPKSPPFPAVGFCHDQCLVKNGIQTHSSRYHGWQGYRFINAYENAAHIGVHHLVAFRRAGIDQPFVGANADVIDQDLQPSQFPSTCDALDGSCFLAGIADD